MRVNKDLCDKWPLSVSSTPFVRWTISTDEDKEEEHHDTGHALETGTRQGWLNGITW